jgi:hypothetical protein
MSSIVHLQTDSLYWLNFFYSSLTVAVILFFSRDVKGDQMKKTQIPNTRFF